jgi:PAS domain S-box-containing protein
VVDRSNIESRDLRHVAAVSEITFTLDLSGYFKCVNSEGQRLSGYSSEEVRRLHVSEVVVPELADLVRQQFRRTIQRRVGVVYEIEIITRDRRRVALEASIHLVMQDGRPVEIQGIAILPTGSLRQTPARCLDANFALGTLSGTDDPGCQ